VPYWTDPRENLSIDVGQTKTTLLKHTRVVPADVDARLDGDAVVVSVPVPVTATGNLSSLPVELRATSGEGSAPQIAVPAELVPGGESASIMARLPTAPMGGPDAVGPGA
jgi:hypothetical protein